MILFGSGLTCESLILAPGTHMVLFPQTFIQLRYLYANRLIGSMLATVLSILYDVTRQGKADAKPVGACT